MEYKCRHCNIYFQDGEYVSKKNSDKWLYHTNIRYLDIHPTTCLEAVFMNSLGRKSKTNYLYYQGKLYNLLAIDMLSNFEELSVDFNDNKNGERLIGNLEGLINKNFFSRILSKIFYC